MKNIITFLGAIIIASFIVISCGQNNNKQKELELREREIAIKEKELGIKENDTSKQKLHADTLKINLSNSKQNDSISNSVKPLMVNPLSVSGDMGQITFSQNDKTIFYFDAKTKKGKIRLNGIEYVINKLQYDDEGGYKFYGSAVNITTTKGNWAEMESDCGYGTSLVVTINMGSQVLKLNNVEVQDCSSMVE